MTKQRYTQFDRNQPKLQRVVVTRCKDCCYGVKGPKGILCNKNGRLQPRHPELFCEEAEARR